MGSSIYDIDLIYSGYWLYCLTSRFCRSYPCRNAILRHLIQDRRSSRSSKSEQAYFSRKSKQPR